MKKAQLQTMEPIIVVIFLALILGIGLLFYMRISNGLDAQELAAANQVKNTKLMAVLSGLPELSCHTNTNCIDLLKARVLKNHLQNNEAKVKYFSLFGATNITISWIDLETQEENSIELYNALASENVVTARTYFTVYDPVTRKHHFAIMTVEAAP